MMYFSQAPSMIFGSPLGCLFTADPSSCINKRYFLLGKLCAVSILSINRGPECLHPALVDRDIGNTISFDDENYSHKAREIDSGKFDALFDAGINPADANAKDMYSLHFSILSSCAAIIDFTRGVNRVCPDILAKYEIFASDIRYTKLNLKAPDILR